MFFKKKIKLDRLNKVIMDAFNYDVGDVNHTSDGYWHYLSIKIDNIVITKHYNEREDSEFFISAEVPDIKISIQDQEKELVVYHSKEYVWEKRENGSQYYVSTGYDKYDYVVWKHEGPWCDFISKAIDDLERNVEHEKKLRKRKLEEKRIKEEEETANVISHFREKFGVIKKR
jgi:hypothetical protein